MIAAIIQLKEDPLTAYLLITQAYSFHVLSIYFLITLARQKKVTNMS